MDSRPALLLKNLRKDLVEVFPHMRDYLSQPVELSANSQEAAVASLMASIFKKWVPTQKADFKRLAHPAIASFVACNDECESWSPPDHPLYARVYDVLQRNCYTAFDDIDISWDVVFQKARMGPGASVASKGKNSYFEKLFLNRMSTDSVPLYRAYLSTLQSSPVHYAAEMRRRVLRGAKHLRIVVGSTLSTVRKNEGTDRTICTEASLNMYAQLGVGEIINDVLRSEFGYCPAVQQKRNRELARRGSRGGNICTVDSTSASDLIAWLLTQRTLHPLLSAVIDDCRSTCTKIDGKYVQLHMVSSMGNGFTFPLMTYLFAASIKALCEVLNFPFTNFDKPGSPYGVFGDDICVPTALYEPLCGFLRSLGFKPNLQKSFHQGPFRESCGGDFFLGEDVRGVYIKKLDTQQDVFSAVNRLNDWSARHLIPLRRTIRSLLEKGWTKYVVPYDEADTAGVKCNFYGNNRRTYTRFSVVSDHITIWRFKRGEPIGFRRSFDNPMGALLMTINGSLMNGTFTRKEQTPRYVEEVIATSNVWACDNDFNGHCVGKTNWEVFSAYNLGLTSGL